MQIRQFTGYSSQADQLLIDPSKLSQALNICINKGAICNLPYPKETASFGLNVFSWADNGGREKLGVFYLIDSIPWLMVYDATGQIYISKFSIFEGNPFQQVIFDFSSFEHFGNFNTDINYKVSVILPNNIPISGNLLQIGPYIYQLAQLGELNIRPIPRMIKFRQISNTNQTRILGVIGQKSFASVSVISTDIGSITGTFDYAFTLATGDSNDDDFATELTSEDIESNAIAIGTASDYTSNNIRIRGYFQPGETTAGPLLDEVQKGHIYKIGIYSRSSSQGFYYFTNYQTYSIEQEGVDEIGSYVEFIIDNLTAQNLTKTAPGIGDSPQRGVPNPSVHAVEFKSRLYYANLQSNQLEYSQVFLDDSPFKIESQYVEGAELIGGDEEHLSGLIVYLGQLIIFKTNSTYVLTDEITQGQIRQLFNRGCVNANGGKAYVIIDDILYFLDVTGLYAWNGQNDPIRISMDIDEDLRNVKEKQYKYARLTFDERYKHLYLTFPKAHLDTDEQSDIGCFIYHYGELQENGLGVWTKMTVDTQLSQILTAPNGDVYYNRRKRLERMGFIEDETVLDTGGRIWAWQTGILDFGHPIIDKHIRHLYMYLHGFIDTDQYALGYTLKETFKPDQLLSDIITAKDQVRLGFTAQKMILSMNSYSSSTTRRAFRIGGYDIVAHPKKGR